MSRKNLKQQTLFDMKGKKPASKKVVQVDDEMEDLSNEVLQAALMESLSQQEEIKGGEEEVKESFKTSKKTKAVGGAGSELLKDLGYSIVKLSPDDKYGAIRQTADHSKGIEWKGQDNYDIIAECMMKYV